MALLIQISQQPQEKISEMGPLIIVILLLFFMSAAAIVALLVFISLRGIRPGLTYFKCLKYCIVGGAIGVAIHTYAIVFNRIQRESEDVNYYATLILASLILGSMILFSVIVSLRNRV